MFKKGVFFTSSPAKRFCLSFLRFNARMCFWASPGFNCWSRFSGKQLRHKRGISDCRRCRNSMGGTADRAQRLCKSRFRRVLAPKPLNLLSPWFVLIATRTVAYYGTSYLRNRTMPLVVLVDSESYLCFCLYFSVFVFLGNSKITSTGRPFEPEDNFQHYSRVPGR